MIGLQELIIQQNIKVMDLAKEIDCSSSNFYNWLRNNRIPKPRLKVLAERFNVTEEYLNTKVNDISTYEPKKIGFCNEYIIEGNTTKIILNRRNKENLITLIDTEDLEKLKIFNRTWSASYAIHTDSYYAHVTLFIGKINGKRKYSKISLQTFLMNPQREENICVDHHNHNTLDNHKDNLRVTNDNKNLKHRNGANRNSKTGVRNVTQDGNQYLVQIMKDGVRYKWEFPINQFKEACDFADKKRNELFKDYSGNGIKIK